ncbi:MAG: hypothetical protein WBH08_10120 [Methanothrix sp.]
MAAVSSLKSMNEEGEDGSMASQSTTYGTSISKDVAVQSKYGSLKMNLSSDSVGRTNVEYCSDKLKLSEEYLGGFHIEETIANDEYQRSVNTTDESCYVDVYKKVGEDYSSYERGSGLYQAEEIIEAGDYARKNVILAYSPTGYSYSTGSVANRSHMWEEGFELNASNGLYAEEHYTNLAKMEKEVEVKWSIRRIDAGRRRTVSFMAWAERDGLFEVKALVSGNSTEGNEIISTSSSALVVVGKPPRASNIESLQSINGCHAVIAPCINPWQK